MAKPRDAAPDEKRRAPLLRVQSKRKRNRWRIDNAILENEQATRKARSEVRLFPAQLVRCEEPARNLSLGIPREFPLRGFHLFGIRSNPQRAPPLVFGRCRQLRNQLLPQFLR